MPVTIYPTNLKYKNSNGQFQSATAIKGDSGAGIVEQVNGTAPTIVCEDNHRYICGEVLSLNITPPANGACEIIFESGSTATLLTAPNTIKWPEWFNPNSLETSATYQFKISNGLANVAIWPDEGLTGDTRVRIQKMLGIYEAPWELIREDTVTNATSAAYEITVDGNGNPFALTDLILYFETPMQATEAKLETYGWIDIYYGDSSFYTLELGAWTQSANAAAHGAFGILERVGNLLKIEFTKQNTSGQHEPIGIRYQTNDISRAFILNGNREFVKIKIRSFVGTAHYIVYGRRAWS